MTYFDSCYMAKLYLSETDSAKVRAHAAGAQDLVCCIIGWGEIVATFHRHFRDGRLTKAELKTLTLQAEADIAGQVWKPLPVTRSLIQAQTRRMAALPASVSLRNADALHLTCAAEMDLTEIYSNDRHLLAAAPFFDLQAITL